MTAPASPQSVVEKVLSEHLRRFSHNCSCLFEFAPAPTFLGDTVRPKGARLHRAHVAAEVVTALADAGLLRRPVSGWASRFAPLPVEVVSDE